MRLRRGDVLGLDLSGDRKAVLEYVGQDENLGHVVWVCAADVDTTSDDAVRRALASSEGYFVCCPIDIAVERQQATRLSRVEGKRKPVFRKRQPNGEWVKLEDGRSTRLGTPLSPEERRLSVYSLLTPLALREQILAGYRPEQDYAEPQQGATRGWNRLFSPRRPTRTGSDAAARGAVASRYYFVFRREADALEAVTALHDLGLSTESLSCDGGVWRLAMIAPGDTSVDGDDLDVVAGRHSGQYDGGEHPL